MGASLVYLEKPNKDIIWELGENKDFRFVAAGMQGWRINMVSQSFHNMASILVHNGYLCNSNERNSCAFTQ